MLAGLSVTVLLCGQFEQVYVLEEKKTLVLLCLVFFSLRISACFLLLMVQSLKFLVISMNGIDSTKSLQFMKSVIACL